jgi:hypothetical protein
MKRTLVLPALVSLALAPAAMAKGPHAILSSAPEAVEAGQPWDVTLELMEAKGRSRPTLMARRGDRLIAVRGGLASSDGFMSRYELQVEFPSEGRWRLAVVDRKRRFEFPAVAVGSGRVPQDYVAFPMGSMAERQGGGGPYDVPEQSVGFGEQLPPETVRLAAEAPGDGDNDGFAIWILPLVGLVLAGATRMARRARAQRP